VDRRGAKCLAALLGLVPLASCGDSPTGQPLDEAEAAELSCTIDTDLIFNAAAKDAIPALTDPTLVPAEDAAAGYLRDRFRIVGIRVGGIYIAVPHNILWWHEIVNFDFADGQLAVTYCPLTGSGLVFDRGSVGGAELGVSGLLFQNNLVMHDRQAGSSLFPQMMRQGACGPGAGRRLAAYPAIEMTWAAWKALHPETLVVSGATGYARDYTRYPYGSYESLGDSTTLYPMDPFDTTRPPKERVLGIPDDGEGGVAFPFGALSRPGEARTVVPYLLGDEPIVILWEEDGQAAAAFHRRLDGQALDLVVRDGRFADEQTGSVWAVDGRAVEGPLQGSRLTPVSSAFVSFWFAWAAFQPQAETWLPTPSGLRSDAG
jgi:hypothetical protein